MGELRQKFEVLEQVAFIIHGFAFNETDNEYEAPSIVPDYTIGVVNGMWIMFQDQQSKIEQLEKRIEMITKSIDSFFDEQTMTPSSREYSNFIADVGKALRGECG